ncbi:RNA-directed DNA polymerase, eukaryota, Reverse transcriptase zinc-binding domain protein [Artemisia annua]|uniref:RNA-directed DNA polymerase, eukaryota, Reverse transcriptase zinc-binding domain protein n=1 Tax=Artemisia annua TaxID=35608 RepID=A0A2U1MU66_ARTAN|nr:RNA-directed DNA polymerase, eukaryota, Reverse transcriptase zinc-binding domain protein [Artemisia annua]
MVTVVVLILMITLIRLPPSPWKTILGINKPLLSTNIDLNSIFSKRIGNGSSTILWSNVWFGTADLKSLFPRLHTLETDKGCLVSARCTLLSCVVHFVWAWSRPIRGVERKQLNNLLGLLQHFSPTNSLDLWICNLNNTTKVFVSSMQRRIEDSILLSSVEHVVLSAGLG